ncbi:PQQ-dependent sugar dehydrogenase [Modestobacter sp. VKM Ac-2986]|uniref:PQQ-dependent sugar dehydrogenase n=1 Tax=Modestobacter sp. VKM Ac-2986 TaxID=3004140 RepID=UPI0022AB78F6|nr:PQQ-dependent sugar dehydrogenase [Modestobacter sp. VKM Ac-2986]MCZ2829523.1 PQQ-dependent sugar dehydrogenase [Modestobacter sp. VKM Ac-2986]
MGRRSTAPGARRLAAVAVGCLLLAGCGGDGYEPAGPFRELPQGQPPQVAPPPEGNSIPAPPAPGSPGGEKSEGDPNVVATDLAVPTGLVVLPDGTAVVGERDTGRLLQVFPDRSPARELMTVPGIDTAGDGGLLGLAISPTFTEDGLYYAYVSTATDNRVVRFPAGGVPNPVLTGIPHGEQHNGGGLLFGADGTLYVGTGDVGDPALAADPASLAGKVLAVDVFGQPVGAGPVFTSGHRDVTALCSDGVSPVFAVDPDGDAPDELEVLADGRDLATAGPVIEIAAADAGLAGCAVTGPYVFLGALDGERVHVVELDGTGAPVGEPTPFLQGQYGRLRTVVLGGDGALWITTSNEDGIGTPAEDDDRVLRILPPAGGASSPL